MAETIDIRELNERIELVCCPMDMCCWKVCPVWQRL